jgi:hypothetical protein
MSLAGPAVPAPKPTQGSGTPVGVQPPQQSGPVVTSAPAAAMHGGDSLGPGDDIVSPNGHYKLVMQADGNLVLYHDGDAIWSTGSKGAGASLAMQTDGNLVIYNNGATWSSNTADFPGAELDLQDDGNLVIYHAGHAIWTWGRGYIGDQLGGGDQLEPGAYLLSADHQYELVMQASDGNLVLYRGAQALWSSGQAGVGAYVAMQGDGNFVTYNNGAKWSSNTADFPGANLTLQNDSNVVISHAGHPIWDSHSGYLGFRLSPGWQLGPDAYLWSPNHQYRLVMQASDGNLVLYDRSGKALWSTGARGAGAYVAMQGDGNLVIYLSGVAKWASNTAGHGGAYFSDQDDANQVIYQGATPLWASNSGGGGGGSGSTAENAAIAWARPYADAHDTSYNGLCLTFVFNAWSAAGVNLRNWVNVAIGGDTYPADIWGHFTHGSTGTGTPPVGALVFWNASNGDRTESHVALSEGGGNLVSSSDAVASYTHYETTGQHAYAVYLGWWLPDQ